MAVLCGLFLALAVSSAALAGVGSHELLVDDDNHVVISEPWMYSQGLRSPAIGLAVDSFPTMSNHCLNAFERLTPLEEAQLFDSIGKPGAGLMNGNFFWYGDFLSCQNMEQARYCYSGLSVNLTEYLHRPTVENLRWGLCLPSVCTDEDFAGFLFNLNKVNSKYGAYAELAIGGLVQENVLSNVTYAVCDKPIPRSTGFYVSLSICILFVLLLFFGTLLEWFTARPVIHSNGSWGHITVKEENLDQAINSAATRSNHTGAQRSTNESTPLLGSATNPSYTHHQYSSFVYPWPVRFLRCFALQRNLTSVLDARHHPGTVPSLHGLRVLSMFWVILGHTYIWPIMTGVSNLRYLLTVIQRFTFMFVINGTYSVDTFFFLSGLLVMFLSLRRMDNNSGQLGFFKFYLHRYLRLTPMYMFLLMLYVNIVPFWGSGPNWSLLFGEVGQKACKKYWWANLLYINNFIPDRLYNSCMGWAWYLANDMQFYILSPFLIHIAYRFRRIGLALVVSNILLLSLLANALLVYFNNFRIPDQSGGLANGEILQQKHLSYSDIVYEKPYCRVGPYLVGLFMGYILRRHNATESFLPRGTARLGAALGWALCAVLLLCPVYGLYNVYHNGAPLSELASILFYTFSRLSWALGLAWLVWACHTGYGGYVNSILSHHFWIPLSRLTFAAYLIHPVVLSVMVASWDVSFYYTDTSMVFVYLGALTVSYLMAFAVAIGVEFPCLEVEKLIFFQSL